MARLGSGQRVVVSIKDRSGRAYTKTSDGGKARISSATKYIDQKEQARLYEYDDYDAREISRQQALERVEQTETKYQQHLAFTTKIEGDRQLGPSQEQRVMRELGEAIQQRRPDAEIYGMAMHYQGEGGNIHVHVTMGTATTLRRDDLTYFRQMSYQMEQGIREEMSWYMNAAARAQQEQQRQQLDAQRQAVMREAMQPRTEPPTLDRRDLKPDAPRMGQFHLPDLKPAQDAQDESSGKGKAGGREAENEGQEKTSKQRQRDYGLGS